LGYILGKKKKSGKNTNRIRNHASKHKDDKYLVGG
jgi:hypothetical protein